MIALLAITALLIQQGDSLRFGPADVDTLPPATTRIDHRAGRLVLETPLIEVPAGETIRTPVFRASVPANVSLHRFLVEVVDEAGRLLPLDRLHHFIMTDTDRRELFAPLALPIFGASKESPTVRLPRYLIGMPLPAGGRYIMAGMLTNPEARALRLRVRVVFEFVPTGRLVPLLRAFPWTMDVKFPLGGEGGRHDFELPPGRSSYAWQGSPRIPGTIIGMGAHAHDYATAIAFVDVTTGDTIWRQIPVRDAGGRVLSIPFVRFTRWYRLGIHIEPSHTYRVMVSYDNPTGAAIPFGGMGAVGGLLVPDWGVAWPTVDRNDPIYRTQINNLLSNMAGMMMDHEAHRHAR